MLEYMNDYPRHIDTINYNTQAVESNGSIQREFLQNEAVKAYVQFQIDNILLSECIQSQSKDNTYQNLPTLHTTEAQAMVMNDEGKLEMITQMLITKNETNKLISAPNTLDCTFMYSIKEEEQQQIKNNKNNSNTRPKINSTGLTNPLKPFFEMYIYHKYTKSIPTHACVYKKRTSQ
eukprot:UN03460